MSKIIKEPSLIDAWQMHEENPDTFEVPLSSTTDKLKVGDCVKLAAHGERFWVSIVSRDGDDFVGEVDPGLVFDDGDHIAFHASNIYDVYFAKNSTVQ